MEETIKKNNNNNNIKNNYIIQLCAKIYRREKKEYLVVLREKPISTSPTHTDWTLGHS